MALDFDLLATHCGVDWSDRRGGKIWLRWLASMALLSPQAPYKRKQGTLERSLIGWSR